MPSPITTTPTTGPKPVGGTLAEAGPVGHSQQHRAQPGSPDPSRTPSLVSRMLLPGEDEVRSTREKPDPGVTSTSFTGQIYPETCCYFQMNKDKRKLRVGPSFFSLRQAGYTSINGKQENLRQIVNQLCFLVPAESCSSPLQNALIQTEVYEAEETTSQGHKPQDSVLSAAAGDEAARLSRDALRGAAPADTGRNASCVYFFNY